MDPLHHLISESVCSAKGPKRQREPFQRRTGKVIPHASRPLITIPKGAYPARGLEHESVTCQQQIGEVITCTHLSISSLRVYTLHKMVLKRWKAPYKQRTGYMIARTRLITSSLRVCAQPILGLKFEIVTSSNMTGKKNRKARIMTVLTSERGG